VFVPFHWGGRVSANLLTKAALDPIARIPEFKACAVHVAAAPAKPATPGAATMPAAGAPGAGQKAPSINAEVS
jgi:assimilatory nitrate reductase catalytic subunit